MMSERALLALWLCTVYLSIAVIGLIVLLVNAVVEVYR